MEIKNKFKQNHFTIILLGLLCLIIIGIFAIRMMTSSPIVLKSTHEEVQINSIVDYTSYIEKIKKGKIEDIEIDSSLVKLNQLGDYDVIYKWKDYEKKMTLSVVDNEKPVVKVNSMKIAVNQQILPEDFIEKITDDTETSLSFAEDIDVSQVGQLKVHIRVLDECQNETIVDADLEVVEDKKAPQVIVNELSIPVNETEEYLKERIRVRDDFDQNPEIKIKEGTIDQAKIGTYQAVVNVKDFSGNTLEKAITVHVKDDKDFKERVVYLTFDDGPSRYTKDVLSILKKYDCYATFFITGMNKSYYVYIKKAYDQGHTIGLHTYSHNYQKVYASTDAYFKDLEKVGRLAKSYIGYVPRYIRFPGGSSNTISKKYSKGIMTKLTKMVEDQGYIYYDWNAENGDGYSHMAKSQMIKRATSSSRDEIMILMHDANGKKSTVETLPEIIDYYQKKGYVFKAIDDTSFIPHQNVNN